MRENRLTISWAGNVRGASEMRFKEGAKLEVEEGDVVEIQNNTAWILYNDMVGSEGSRSPPRSSG